MSKRLRKHTNPMRQRGIHGQSASLALRVSVGAPRRRGGALIVALAVLAVLAVVEGVVLKSLVAQRRSQREQAERLQARWLAEAGIERAAARLAADPDYRRETWQLGADELGTQGPAAVDIEVRMDATSSDVRLVSVRGRYPPDLPHRVVCEKQVSVLISNLKKQP
jgi:hypothetical protein